MSVDDFGHQLQELCAERKGANGTVVQPNFKWRINALRHSFISYRVADLQDVARVALEAGNSRQMVFSNYRQLVTPKEAKRWFSMESKGS